MPNLDLDNLDPTHMATLQAAVDRAFRDGLRLYPWQERYVDTAMITREQVVADMLSAADRAMLYGTPPARSMSEAVAQGLQATYRAAEAARTQPQPAAETRPEPTAENQADLQRWVENWEARKAAFRLHAWMFGDYLGMEISGIRTLDAQTGGGAPYKRMEAVRLGSRPRTFRLIEGRPPTLRSASNATRRVYGRVDGRVYVVDRADDVIDIANQTRLHVPHGLGAMISYEIEYAFANGR